jgi:predicted Zn-dependent protease
MISISKHQNSIFLRIKADILNSSSQHFDLQKLKNVIISQIATVFNQRVGKYTVHCELTLRILKNNRQCSAKRILFQVVDDTLNGNVAIADFKGLRVKLNKQHVDSIILNSNIRTIPHELGHLLGLDHPHARAAFESINQESHILEQQLTEPERQRNLMSQSWYAQKAAVPLNEAMQLTEQQIDLVYLNFITNTLNTNYHLNYFLWWKKLRLG